jgi:hypothetical protein
MSSPDSNDATLRPLFVLSVWRSGSSLLHALLNQHSQIGLLYEGELPQLQLLLRRHLGSGGWRETWEFWNRGPSRHGIPLDFMPANVADAWEATRIVYQKFARRKKATIWGEKSPHWYHNALCIARKFPDAQFIFLWRDVSAVLKSIAHAAAGDRFFRKPGFAQRVLVGSEKLRHACNSLRSEGRAVHELNYEDLVSDTEHHMQEICRFLGLQYEPQMASLEGADRSATFAGNHHALVRGNRIIHRRKGTEALSPAVRQKIARYVCRWKTQSDGEWPKYPVQLANGAHPPKPFELFRDRVVYRTLLCGDGLSKLIYAVVPLAVAHSVRSLLHQHTYTKPSLQTSR